MGLCSGPRLAMKGRKVFSSSELGVCPVGLVGGVGVFLGQQPLALSPDKNHQGDKEEVVGDWSGAWSTFPTQETAPVWQLS